MKKRKRILFIILLLLPAVAFFLYTADYYHANDTAAEALRSDSVRIEQTAYGWFFDGPDDKNALIFYPGAKVEETAYAPLLHEIAAQGMDVLLVRMPFNLAVFGMNAADGIMSQYEYTNWYIGGHSLGGAVAANYAAERDLAGVILLASYPTKEVDEPILILYGSEDGVLNRARLDAAPQFGSVEEVVIEGGNHAGFGEYGNQKGDGVSAIPAGEQRQIAVRAILAWLPGR